MTGNDLEKKEALAKQYVSEKRTQEAVGLVYELIAVHARNRNFEKAEALREWLYDVDPMAITEIVKAADIIEAEKAQARDEKHLQPWREFYEKLSDEEANAFYYSLKSAEFEPGEVIAQQGDLCGQLYFINRGEIKAVFRQKNEEQYLMTLGPGSVFGLDSFFTSTVCTVTLIAASEVKTGFLEKNVLKKWKTEVPRLENRLLDFCRQKDHLRAVMKEAGVERRKYHRVPAEGGLVFQMLDREGKELGRDYKGELVDISAGGVAFMLKISRPEAAGILLGRRLRVRFDLEFKDGTARSFDLNGKVTAVQDQGFDEYSVHLKFDEPLAESAIHNAAGRDGSGAT